MAKYSDLVGNGERSPTNFHEQLLRLTGEMPLNVFATINNRLSMTPEAPGVHASLEQQFLSDSVRGKLARLRRRSTDEEPHVLFTRLGALIALKLLLGTPRGEGTPKPTAVGAVAIHANDYAESFDTSDMSRGLLPLVAEYAATWELVNPRNVGVLLRRTNYIYNRILLSDSRLCRLAAEKLGCGLADVRFAGLSYERYFALLFGMYVTVKNGATKQNTSIVDADELRRLAHFPATEFAEFVAARSETVDGFRAAVGALADRNEFSDAVTDPAWCSDFRIFRSRPLLRLVDGRFVVLDMQFLIENASAGLYWHLASNFDEDDRKRLSTYWGTLFEQYVQRLVRYYAGATCGAGVEVGNSEIDVSIRAGDDLILLEVKSGFIAQDVKGSRDRAALDAELSKKYLQNQKGHPKGLMQLARAAGELLSSRDAQYSNVRNVYPVLVVEDPVLQTFVMNSYLDDIFRRECAPDESVKPLTVLLIDELEELLPHIYAGDTSWPEVLESRFIKGGVVVEPMHTSFSYFAIRRKLRRRSNTFLDSEVGELNRIIAEQYASLQSKT